MKPVNRIILLTLVAINSIQMRAYHNISPYTWCGGNPIKFVDPDGTDIKINGAKTNIQMVVTQVQNHLPATSLYFVNGNLFYTEKVGVFPSPNDLRIRQAIDNHLIVATINVTSGFYNSKGGFLIGGAYMGTQLLEDKTGNKIAVSNQEINPNILKSIDNIHGVPVGTNTLHEFTECIEGASLSLQSGMPSASGGQPDSNYENAHNVATPQSGIINETFYDKNGVETKNPNETARVEYWSVDSSGNIHIFLTFP